MDKNTAKKAEQGLVVDGRPLFGDENRELRAALYEAGARYNSKEVLWLFPDRETLERFLPRLPGKAGLATKLPRGGNGTGLPVPRLAGPSLPPANIPPPAPPAAPPASPPDAEKPGAGTVQTAEPEQKQAEEPEGQRVKALLLPASYVICGEVEVIPMRRRIRRERLSEEEKTTDEGDGTQTLEATRTIRVTTRNVKEHKAAQKKASELRYSVRKICQATILGPIAPLDKEAELDEALLTARREARAFNENAQDYLVRIGLVKGMIAANDAAAAREFTYDFQEILTEMRAALKACDVKSIRRVAARGQSMLKGLSALIPERERSIVSAAILQAREMATKIVQEVGAKGRLVEDVKKELNTSAVDLARMSFLEYEVSPELTGFEPAVDAFRFNGLDEQNGAETEEESSPAVGVDKRFGDL